MFHRNQKRNKNIKKELLCEYNFFLRIRKFSNSKKNSHSKNKNVSENGPGIAQIMVVKYTPSMYHRWSYKRM